MSRKKSEVMFTIEVPFYKSDLDEGLREAATVLVRCGSDASLPHLSLTLFCLQ